jgi:hypothetical protein
LEGYIPHSSIQLFKTILFCFFLLLLCYCYSSNECLIFFVLVVKRLEMMRKQNPTFALFLGDWIYSDTPWFIHDTVPYYHSRYRNVFQDPYVQQFVTTIPSVWMCILSLSLSIYMCICQSISFI